MGELVAGHVFEHTSVGEVCLCGKRWVDIAGAMRADIGKDGFAHQGALSETEYGQIVQKRDRTWLAVVKVASP